MDVLVLFIAGSHVLYDIDCLIPYIVNNILLPKQDGSEETPSDV